MHDGHAESQRSHGEVGAFEAQGRQPQDESEKRGDKARREDRHNEGHLQLHHQEGCAIGADGEETGVPQGNLPGVADQDVEADGQDDVNENDVQQKNVVCR